MTQKTDSLVGDRLSGEDLTFWWSDSPQQPTTMAMLMLLDRVPDARRVRCAFERAVAAVPRLAQRVVDAPFDLTLPRWQWDPTFDLDYHVRWHALPGRADFDELLHGIARSYETPFDRSRPLWEVRVYEGVHGPGEAAVFIKLHHAVADGVGGNALLGAITDAERDAEYDPGTAFPGKGVWSEVSFVRRFFDALADRADLDIGRAAAALQSVRHVARHPQQIGRVWQMVRSSVELASFRSHSLDGKAGRARRLSCIALPFDRVHAIKDALGGAMIDVILTIMTRAIGKWYAAHGDGDVRELMTLVPINLRKREEWTQRAHLGNVASGILLPLPIRIREPLAAYEEIHRRVERKKDDPLSTATPEIAELASLLPRRMFTWLAEMTFGNVDFIVTNVPGIRVTRYLGGVEVVAAYPFAPVALKSPVSIALYGYRDQLFVGLDTDEVLMPDAEAFRQMIGDSFTELERAVRRRVRRLEPRLKVSASA